GHGVIINTASQAGKAPYALAVSPPAVDTPLFQHSANYTGRVIKPPKPIVTADKAALAIVRCAERPKREVSVGIMPAVMGLFRTFMKPIWERVAPAMMRHEHLGKTPAADGRCNLFAPMPPAGESGGWKKLGEKAALPSLAAPTLEAG
ncbi:MAG TPA: hypothetical protein VGH63_15960, partial [Polyangia bacterium]